MVVVGNGAPDAFSGRRNGDVKVVTYNIKCIGWFNNCALRLISLFLAM